MTDTTTLTPLIVRYTTTRRKRGEITAQTASDYRHTLALLDRSFGHRPIERLGPKAIDRWLEQIGDRAPATRREYLSRVRSFCRWLATEGHITGDPTDHVEPIRQARRVPVTLTERQVGQLLRHLHDDPRGLAVVWIMIGCGARCVEVARLQVEDYDPVGATFVLRGKAGHERVVPVPMEVASAVDGYLDAVGISAGPLIRSKRTPSQGVSPKTLSIYLTRWLYAAGVKARGRDGRSAHGLRRTAASDVMDRTGEIRVVQAMLGHERVETTARHYLRPVTVEQMRQAMAGRSYDEAA